MRTATQTNTIAEVGGCSQVSVTITGSIGGTVDDGGGFDQVQFELWDDGELKDFELVRIPVGVTRAVNVTLGFQGLYKTGAPGVGVYVYDLPDDQEPLFVEDPFFPTDVQGTCEVPASVPVLGGNGAFFAVALGLLVVGLVAMSRAVPRSDRRS